MQVQLGLPVVHRNVSAVKQPLCLFTVTCSSGHHPGLPPTTKTTTATPSVTPSYPGLYQTHAHVTLQTDTLSQRHAHRSSDRQILKWQIQLTTTATMQPMGQVLRVRRHLLPPALLHCSCHNHVLQARTKHHARASTAGSHCSRCSHPKPQHGSWRQQAFNCEMQNQRLGRKVCSAHTASWLGEPAASSPAMCPVLSSAPHPQALSVSRCQLPPRAGQPHASCHTAFGFVQAGGLDNNDHVPVQPLCPTNSPSAQQAARQPCVR